MVNWLISGAFFLPWLSLSQVYHRGNKAMTVVLSHISQEGSISPGVLQGGGVYLQLSASLIPPCPSFPKTMRGLAG